jgi:RNA polymerase sigma factor (sigma-70 family)
LTNSFIKFKNENSLLFDNILIQKFFSDIANVQLCSLFLLANSFANEFEKRFQNFYFDLRFSKYLSSTIKFSIIDFNRKKVKRQERYLLILDQPFQSNKEVIHTDEMFSDNQVWNDEMRNIKSHSLFLDLISNHHVYSAFNKLTENQKTVLTYSFAYDLLDVEIAKLLKVSQQAVSKSRKVALKKMKESLALQQQSENIPRERK